jgi:hypothetical protein
MWLFQRSLTSEKARTCGTMIAKAQAMKQGGNGEGHTVFLSNI